MKTMDGCYYASLGGQVFGLSQIVPTFMTLCLTVMGLATHQIMFPLFGIYLDGAQMVLWIFQSYFQAVRPNPICQLYNTYAFPSITMYYVASLITFVFVYGYFWDVAHSWVIWLIFYLVGFGLPLILVHYSFNRVWEVLFSVAFGIVFTSVFVIVLKFYICPVLPFILSDFPSTWMGYRDEFLMSPEQKQRFKQCAAALKDENTSVVRG